MILYFYKIISYYRIKTPVMVGEAEETHSSHGPADS